VLWRTICLKNKAKHKRRIVLLIKHRTCLQRPASQIQEGKLILPFSHSASSEQPQDTSALVQSFLNSLGSGSRQTQQMDKPYTTLPDLLTPATTIPYLSSLSSSSLNALCAHLPAELFLLDQESQSSSSTTPSPEAAQAAIEALSDDQKREILRKVFHSPQLQQSLGSLTVAIRDGGLPMIAEGLKLKVEHGGLVRGATVPMGGGSAVEGFVEGVKKTVREEEGKKEQ
jgi:26S proteasome regulatory subunit N13